jgi:ATP/maltotriose-dependent transcriptional regulator MalT
VFAGRRREAIEIGSRTIELARELGDEETLITALTNVGTAHGLEGEVEAEREMLDEAITRAVEGGFHDHAGRVLGSAASNALTRGEDAAGPLLERALAYMRDHEQDGFAQYQLGLRGIFRLERGDWDGAESDARESLRYGTQPGPGPFPAYLTLGLIQARRGQPEAVATLDEARERAHATGEPQRLGPAAAARAEHAWLEGDLTRVVEEARAAHDSVPAPDPWTRGRLSFLLWQAGAIDGPPAGTPEPYRLAIAGDALSAAAAWEAMGRPYEAAEALALADDTEPLLRALSIFDRLGARTPAARVRRMLRERGVRAIPRGPRPATQAHPAGLTTRQVEVLRRLATGATNPEIAAALVISPKTVEHHVSAILAKLGVDSRREAARAARDLDQ